MSGSGFKTVATASVLASSILYIGYLWYKHREEQQEDSYPPSPISPSGITLSTLEVLLFVALLDKLYCNYLIVKVLIEK